MIPGAHRTLRALAAALLSTLLFAGAAALLDPALRGAPADPPLSDAEEAAIQGALVDFQRIYQDFFATGGAPALIDAFPATREVKHHLFRDIGFVRDAGLVLVQDLATATLVETRRTGGDTAEALVYEEWNHVFQRASDRVPVSTVKGLGQGFRYHLRREAGRWVVTAWDPEDVARPALDDGWHW